MKNTIKFLQIGLLSGLLFMIACTGEKGAVGPQGIPGTVGLVGDKGDTGAKGEFSKVLTGNVIVKPANWFTQTVNTANDGFTVVIAEKQITKAILDKGIVIVYNTSFTGGNISTIMPYTSGNTKFLHFVYLDSQTGEGRIKIDLHPANTSTKLGRPTADFSFRWVIASGS